MAVRKTVTVLFSDIAGSTSLGETLDVESFRRVLGRYFDEVRAILERHGGTPEKFIGDAVVALFGVPTAREDDALRALRAAAEIRERLEVLNDDFERELGIRLGIRTGVNTGEVVVEEGSADGFTASGDTMNVAARLEQAASADEILIGPQTRLLGGDAIVVAEVEALAFKGKADRVDAFRLLRVLPQVSPFGRRDDAPLVGRRRELAALHDALRHACENVECVLATVVGPAGVGKSRLAREFLAQLDDSVRVLVGRCAAYGEGVTFLPLVEAFGPVLEPDPRARVLELFEGDERAGLVADRVGAVFGAGDGGGSAEDTFWAFRRLLERLAVEQPLVLVVDDIHWAEPTLLDLLEYVASFAGGAPMMVLCLTRPELLETRATWAAPRENATVAMLAPLADEESVALVGHLSLDRELDAEELSRIVDAADGNPLFLEQLLALNAEVARAEELVVPPTIQALLAARIDHLDAADRRVLECAAIEGREFHRDAVVELLAEEGRPEIGSSLISLARRQFIRPLRAAEPGDDAFAFVHTLVRESAYSSIPKETRADLHLRLADHLDGLGAAAEIVGHHLAEATGYRRELGRDDDQTREIARRAAERLAEGGRRALAQGDDRGAARLLERACELVPIEDSVGRALRIELGRALAGAGRLDRSRDVFSELRAAAEASGERGLALRAELGLLSLRAQTDVTLRNPELTAAAERALPVFEAEGDERGLARSWYLVHWARFRTGRYAESIDAAERVIEHSGRAGDTREQLRALGAIAMATLWGPTPVDEGFRSCDELVERAGGARLMDAFAHRVRGGLCSMSGAFEQGRDHCRHAVQIYEELGHPISAIGVVLEQQRVERQAGQLDVAARELRFAYTRLRELGDIGYVSWVAAQLALVLAERGDGDEAMELARLCREEMQRDHAFAQIASRVAEATVLAGTSQRDEAEAIAAEALALVEQTDMLDLHGDVLVLVADLDRAAGRSDASAERLAQAIALYEQKGDVVSAARARERAGLPQ